MKKRFSLLGAILASMVLAGSALAGGTFPGYTVAPIPLTGNETIPADTNLTQGLQPQTELITPGVLGNYLSSSVTSLRNVLVGGDFYTNPWQRGTSFTSITSSATYTADRWWAIGGGSSSISVSQQTGASDITTGFNASLRFQRANSNADTTAICLGQVLETKDSVKFQGQTAVLSFWAKNGANFSPTAGNVNVTIGTGTGTDGTSANFAAGSWTGYAAQATYVAGVSSATGSVPVSTTWTKYYVTAAIPTTANQVGVKICFTPVGTAGANDWVEYGLMQLEASSAAVASAVPTAFEYQTVQAVLSRAQRYYYAVTEPAANIGVGIQGQSATTTLCSLMVTFPVTMRAAPTFGALGTALANTTWKINQAAQNLALASTYLVTLVGNSPNAALLSATTAASQTAGWGCQLVGAGGGSIIGWSADL